MITTAISIIKLSLAIIAMIVVCAILGFALVEIFLAHEESERNAQRHHHEERDYEN